MCSVIATLNRQSPDFIRCSAEHMIAKNGNLKFKHVFGKKKIEKNGGKG